MSEPIAKKTYYSIGEVCDLTGLKPHVLRYWESQFHALSPSKSKAGNRVYREKDVKLILLVKHLLYEERFTIEGAQRQLLRLREGKNLEERAGEVVEPELLCTLREELEALREILRPVSGEARDDDRD